MMRIAVLLFCITGLSGCYWILDTLEKEFGAYDIFGPRPYADLTPQQQAYFQRLVDGVVTNSDQPLFNYPGGEVDVVNSQLDAWVIGVPTPGTKFLHWVDEPGYLFPGSTHTAVNVSTLGLTGPSWRDYFRDSQDRLSLAAFFSERSSAEMSREPLDLCMPYQILTPNSRTSKVSTLQAAGRELTVMSERWTTSFRKTGANSARFEIRETSRILDEGSNQIAIDRSTQRLGVTWPIEGGATPGVTLYYERTDSERITGETQVSIARFPGGVTQYPAGLDLLNSIYTESGGGELYQGATGPSSAADFTRFTYKRQFSHARVRKTVQMSVNGGPRANAYDCGLVTNEEISIPGASSPIIREFEDRFLSTDSMGFMNYMRTVRSGGAEDTTTLREASYRTDADNSFTTWFFF